MRAAPVTECSTWLASCCNPGHALIHFGTDCHPALSIDSSTRVPLSFCAQRNRRLHSVAFVSVVSHLLASPSQLPFPCHVGGIDKTETCCGLLGCCGDRLPDHHLIVTTDIPPRPHCSTVTATAPVHNSTEVTLLSHCGAGTFPIG